MCIKTPIMMGSQIYGLRGWWQCVKHEIQREK